MTDVRVVAIIGMTVVAAVVAAASETGMTDREVTAGEAAVVGEEAVADGAEEVVAEAVVVGDGEVATAEAAVVQVGLVLLSRSRLQRHIH